MTLATLSLVLVGEKPKTGPAAKIRLGQNLAWPFSAGPIFSTFWQGQISAGGPVCWAKLAGPYYDWAIFAWVFGWVIN